MSFLPAILGRAEAWLHADEGSQGRSEATRVTSAYPEAMAAFKKAAQGLQQPHYVQSAALRSYLSTLPVLTLPRRHLSSVASVQ